MFSPRTTFTAPAPPPAREKISLYRAGNWHPLHSQLERPRGRRVRLEDIASIWLISTVLSETTEIAQPGRPSAQQVYHDRDRAWIVNYDLGRDGEKAAGLSTIMKVRARAEASVGARMRGRVRMQVRG